MRWAIVAASLSLIAGSNIAVAADLPEGPPPQAAAAYIPPPIYNWGGIYLGVNAGYGFASTSDDTATISGNVFGLNGTTTGNDNQLNGFLAGGTIGANYQTGQFVVGIEGDWDWADQSKSSVVGCGVGCSINETGKVEWLATFRGRVGYAFDRVLVYGTAGGAVMNVSDNLSATAGGVSATLLSLAGC
jgi:outer membrane immunogenic protein